MDLPRKTFLIKSKTTVTMIQEIGIGNEIVDIDIRTNKEIEQNT